MDKLDEVVSHETRAQTHAKQLRTGLYAGLRLSTFHAGCSLAVV